MELKVKDVASRLNVSEKTVYKWLNEGTISGKRIGKNWFISDEMFDKKENLTNENKSQNNNISYSKISLEKELLLKFNNLISNGIDYGLENILPPRKLENKTVEFISNHLLNSSGEIYLQGIGLREFFGDDVYSSVIKTFLDEDREIKIKALLVDPMGSYARARAIREYGDDYFEDVKYKSAPLFADSWISFNVIKSIINQSKKLKNFSINVRFVDYWPSNYLVLTDTNAFIENYSFGRMPKTFEGETIEGLLPILNVNNKSNWYQMMKSGFDYIWEGKNPYIKQLSFKQFSTKAIDE